MLQALGNGAEDLDQASALISASPVPRQLQRFPPCHFDVTMDWVLDLGGSKPCWNGVTVFDELLHRWDELFEAPT